MKFGFFALIAVLFFCSCATVKTVRKEDLDSWVGVPVEALDTHSIFLTIPMFKTTSSSGIEIRNYSNSVEVANCYSKSGTLGQATLGSASCVKQTAGCSNIFYIKSGKVLEYAPTGYCYTDDSVRPQARYKTMINSK